MKKTLCFITMTFLLIMVILTLILINVRSNNKVLQQVNPEYEYYLNKEIYGVDIGTLINKAMDHNKRNDVPKDSKGFYVDNGTNSIIITIEMIQTKETYHMEQIYMLGTEQFINLFNSSLFKSDIVTYHKNTGQISEILFKQIAE